MSKSQLCTKADLHVVGFLRHFGLLQSKKPHIIPDVTENKENAVPEVRRTNVRPTSWCRRRTTRLFSTTQLLGGLWEDNVRNHGDDADPHGSVLEMLFMDVPGDKRVDSVRANSIRGDKDASHSHTQ